MTRQFPLLGTLLAAAVAVFSGCQPQQPFYFHESGDLSHYKAVATEIEYPELQAPPNNEVEGALRPFSLENRDAKEVWDLSLEEAVQIALANNKVMRSIGGQVQGPPESILRNLEGTATVYDPALIESNPRSGVEGALAAFDTQFHSLAQWQRSRMPINTETLAFLPGQPPFIVNVQDNYTATFQNRLEKINATGGTVALSNDYINTTSPTNPLRLYHMDWTTEVRAEVRQPLLQGAGVQFNRIAGPGAVLGQANGVMLARVRTDVALTVFEGSVRNLLSDVETSYWELYYTYRALDTAVASRDSALQTWRQVNAKFRAGKSPAHEEAQARQQYFTFVTTVQQALTALYQTESKLRYMLGLATTDGRLIRPKDEPTTAKVNFDWYECLAETMARNVDLRQARWLVKQRELQLIAAKNFLLPKLDLLASYQVQGLGNLLVDHGANATGDFTQPGSNAYQNMLTGGFSNWTVGAELTVPLGFRKEMAGVRNAQLDLTRQRAVFEEAELEASHQLAFAIRDLDSNHLQAQSNFNRRVAARDEVKAALAKYNVGVGTLTDVLDAQRRLADAEGAYYRNIVDYAKAIVAVHLRKGSLLEYNGVYLAEGPWPAKAYFDACRRARARDASLYMDYGFTLPKVISRGPYAQHAEGNEFLPEGPGQPTKATPATEPLPTPAPEPSALKPIPGEPNPESTSATRAVGTRQRRVASNGTPAKRNAPVAGGQTHDLGTLDLAALAAKPSGQWSAASGRDAAVKPAGYDEAAAPAAANSPKSSATTPSSNKWSVPATAGDVHDSAASPPPAEADRPASGWQRMER